jgi:hypothetical protein
MGARTLHTMPNPRSSSSAILAYQIAFWFGQFAFLLQLYKQTHRLIAYAVYFLANVKPTPYMRIEHARLHPVQAIRNGLESVALAAPLVGVNVRVWS